jgi:hypothetical protein
VNEEGLRVTLPPAPDRYSSVVLPVLSFTFTEPVKLPLAVGFDVTVKVQFAPTASELGQLFV